MDIEKTSDRRSRPGRVKIAFSRYTETPPVIDGVSDEKCWEQAESHDDFIDPFLGESVARRTTIRFLHDEENLYVALQAEWDDGDALAQEISRVEQQYAPLQRGIVPMSQFANCCSVELFLDPGASLANYYQIMFNALGQICGNYKAIGSAGFPLKPTFTSVISENGWAAELALPVRDMPGASLRSGSEWGLNVCRNDEGPYSLWKRVGERYCEPKAFGRLILGDYEAWWNSVWADGHLDVLVRMREELELCARDIPWVMTLYEHSLRLGKVLDQTATNHPPISRENIEVLYNAYWDFKRVYDRLNTVLYTHNQMRGIPT